MTTEREIFELLFECGQGLFGKVHVIHLGTTDEYETRYRVYHADGFCFNSERLFPNDETDERDIEAGFEYKIFSDFEGFHKIDAQNILRVLKRSLPPVS